jgi:hypothetical protein
MEVQTFLRKTLNSLLRIQKDSDITLRKRQPSDAEIRAHEDEKNEGPTEKDFSIDWTSPQKSLWNWAAFEVFLKVVQDKEDKMKACDPEYITIPPNEVERVFYDRIKKLKDFVRNGERKAKSKQKNAERTRPQTRKNTLYKARFDITAENAENERHERNKRRIAAEKDQVSEDDDNELPWTFLHGLVVTLGPAGMSSDESGSERINEQRVYLVKEPRWRARWITKHMKLVDGDRNFTTAYGAMRPGNLPRIRKRPQVPNYSTKPAVAELPINCYEQKWLGSLKKTAKDALEAGEKIPVRDIIGAL